jgi:ABC-type multidrug transport system permease subunit
MAVTLAPLYAMWRWAFSVTNGFEIGVYVLGGFMFPISQLPAWLQVVASVFAPTWAVRALYAATGQPFGRQYALWWAVSIALSCGYLVIGWFLYRLVDVRARATGQLALA